MKTLFLVLLALAFYLRYYKGYSWKDIISPSKWKAVYIWLLKKHLKFIDGSDVYLSKNELLQYAYRVARCNECLQVGKCVNCSCDVEGKMNVRTDTCDYLNEDGDKNFGSFLSDEEMDNFLESFKLVFDVKIEKK